MGSQRVLGNTFQLWQKQLSVNSFVTCCIYSHSMNFERIWIILCWEWGNLFPILEVVSYVLTGQLWTFCAWNVYQSEDYFWFIHVIVVMLEVFVPFIAINTRYYFSTFSPDCPLKFFWIIYLTPSSNSHVSSNTEKDSTSNSHKNSR